MENICVHSIIVRCKTYLKIRHTNTQSNMLRYTHVVSTKMSTVQIKDLKKC